jgi:lysozyme family protein
VVLAQSGVGQWGGAMATSAQATETEAAKPSAKASAKPEGKLGEVFESHEKRQAGGLATTLDSNLQWELDRFKALWAEHRTRYEAVSKETDVPAMLIAAIHYRECSGDFTRYLHQGDPLGKAAVRVPTNIPIFHDWHKAAVHAINMKSSIRDSVGIDAETRDPVQLATFAEAYNGLGYHNRDRVSPYVYSGTDVYTGGKYVKDGVFSATAKDKQLGVMVMMDSVGGLEGIDMGPLTPERAWARVTSGSLVLRQGSDGVAVEHLQGLLAAAGQDVTVDGDFGPGTRRVVAAFQADADLEPDGIVGKGTAAALDARARKSRRPDS